MPDSGNEVTVRKIADQLFDAWTVKQEQAQKRQQLLSGSLPAYAALIMSLATLAWQVGVTSQRISDNTRRIQQIEADNRISAAENKTGAQSLARIEAKVDLLMGERGLRSNP